MTSEITAETAEVHGLSETEWEAAQRILGRTPNLVELGIFSVMWSEHCSYKSSKFWLKTLPSEGPQVLIGPGENAGVVDIGDNQALVFKIESHNHPSFIEPYQGAATGVGGILRDVFTMGARPIALLNALRFGDPQALRTRHLLAEVVRGIGGYGNCVGVPTVGGEVQFDPAYQGNPLVNAMAVGLVEQDQIFTSVASQVGNPLVYAGAKTGRDGIHGATMASASFDDAAEAQRPTVQVGDPFTEKLLIEACLELMALGAIDAIQDMGAAGLTSSSFEMASKGGTGVELDLDAVPQRESGMSAYEILLSESQERMLFVLKPGREAEAKAVFSRWGLDIARVGRITDSGRMVIRQQGAEVANLPIDPLALASPMLERPWQEPQPLATPLANPTETAPLETLCALLAHPSIASRRWISEQYDSQVMADTLAGPGQAAAALVRVHGSDKAVAMSTDCNPWYCAADPYTGGQQAVAEAYRNLSATGATPLAITNNLNFGNPEKPEIMGQLVASLRGMGEAAKALNTPVVSGNVSLYNETQDSAILPTPVIGMVGLISDWRRAVGLRAKAGDWLLLLGGWPEPADLGQSCWQDLQGGRSGLPPRVNLREEAAIGRQIREAITNSVTSGSTEAVTACQDIGDGGLLVALAEILLATGLGAELNLPRYDAASLFGEGQARYLVAVGDPDWLLKTGTSGSKPILLGRIGGETLTLNDQHRISIERLRRAHEDWLPSLMETDATKA